MTDAERVALDALKTIGLEHVSIWQLQCIEAFARDMDGLERDSERGRVMKGTFHRFVCAARDRLVYALGTGRSLDRQHEQALVDNRATLTVGGHTIAGFTETTFSHGEHVQNIPRSQLRTLHGGAIEAGDLVLTERK